MVDKCPVDGNVAAVAALVAPHWSEGRRNDLILPLSGLLLRRMTLSDAERVVEAVCAAANDDELPSRLETLRSTDSRLQAGQPCQGAPALAKALRDGGEATVKRLQVLLGGGDPSAACGNGPGFSGRPRRKAYPTRKAAIEALDLVMRGKGLERTGRWNYGDADGRTVATVLRYDGPGGKQYRPVSRHGDAWTIADPPSWPLYRLHELAGAERVFVCEGEKSAGLLAALGLTATTSAHGAKSPRKTDWTPLAGRDCVILPDNDPAGTDYAETVARILTALDPPAVVKVVNLDFPGIGPGDDIEQWLSYWRGQGEDDAQLRARLEAMADAAAVKAPEPPAELPSWTPFPTEALPEPLATFTNEAGAALGADPAFIALPLLAVVAGLIGNSRSIRIKQDWYEPSVLWTAVVAPSGTAKSPASRLALGPLFDVQRKCVEAYRLALQAHATAKAASDVAAKAFARGTGPDPGPPPPAPVCLRQVVSDITIERLAEILEDNPRGVLLYRDELAGWVHNFSRYRSGGSDLPAWLSMHRADAILVDRKGDNRKTTYVARAAVSVTGGIQPGTLARVLATPEAVESGLLARLLLARPPRAPKTWTEATVRPETHQRHAELIAGLLALQPTQLDGAAVPVALSLRDDARHAWIAFYEEWAREQAQADEAVAAALAKLEGYAARLALLHHVVTHVGLGVDDRRPVGRRSIEAGVALARWFAYEARRQYCELAETEAERTTRRLVESVQARGGAITAKELRDNNRRRYPTADEARRALDALVQARLGEWGPRPTTGRGGRPTQEFRLFATSKPRNPETLANADDEAPADAPTARETQDATSKPPQNSLDNQGNAEVSGFRGFEAGGNGVREDAAEVTRSSDDRDDRETPVVDDSEVF
jgi:hypothetical protein